MKQHTIFYGSSYDRGLDVLLELWPRVKKQFPDAKLHIAYGWQTFDILAHNNPERMRWKEKMVNLMRQDGITEHGRMGKAELKKLRQSCGIWAYPATFDEINCITALEAQADGLVPVVYARAALKETVQSGFLVEEDDEEAFYQALIKAMSMSSSLYKAQRHKAIKHARCYKWENIAKQWVDVFNRADEEVKIAVYTPTIRKGWWNIMAHNLSIQTHKNFVWIIIDDYHRNRQSAAIKYASKYNLQIIYLHKPPQDVERTYSLVRANNVALKIAEREGCELLVFAQDFVLMPEDGLEQFTLVHKKDKGALIAAVDYAFMPSVKPKIKKEDWFGGKTDIYGEIVRKSTRIKGRPLTEVDNPFEFEQNYGAIPVKTALELGGWWEFFDDGLGFDNTDIAYRALQAGYKIYIDETNIAMCLHHGNIIGNTETESHAARGRKLNDPVYAFMVKATEQKVLPLKRSSELDKKIRLLYDVPPDIPDEQVVAWIQKEREELVKRWMAYYAGVDGRQT